MSSVELRLLATEDLREIVLVLEEELSLIENELGHDGLCSGIGDGAPANIESTMAAWRNVSLTGHFS
jgi:hypothetical protein